MSIVIAPGLWEQLCAYLQAHPTCKVVLNQHEGRICALEFREVAKEQKVSGGLPRSPWVQRLLDAEQKGVLD